MGYNPNEARDKIGRWISSEGASIPNDKIEKIDMSKIVNTHETIDPVHVAVLKRFISMGIDLPPVELIKLADSGNYAIWDGHHRKAAMAAFGRKQINAVVIETSKSRTL
jgi:ParB-like chromosome segregation protein Spo0J